nr:reverse transcriptase domain-containing protein [Tanacetum cinerariifolium]
VLVVEAALTCWTLLMEIVPIIRNASVALGSRMITPTPSTGQRSTIDIAITIETAPTMRRGEWIVNPHYPAYRKVTSVMEGTGSQRAVRVWFDKLPSESIDSYKDLKAAFLAYFMQQKKYVKNPVEIHNIKQKKGETIEDFMERFKVETGRMKGSPECMWISGFMHGVNNLELTKRLNEHVPKTMEEMMITIAFKRGEATTASKKKRHTSWRIQDHSKRQTSKKSILKIGRDQSKVGKKETPAKDKPTAIYMIQSWQRMTRQKVTQSFEHVREITFPLLATSSGAEGPLVIEVEIGGHVIHHMYVDGGSLTLLVTIEDADHSTRAWMNFMIVRSLSPYNGIIGRPGINKIQAVPSTAYRMLKFPVDRGIVTIRSTILIPVECTMVITSSKEIPKEAGVRHENFKVALHSNFPDQEVAIGGTLSAKGRTKLCLLLKKNLDIFAWQPSYMTGVPRSVAEHRLNIREGYSPVWQKKRGQAPKRAKAIQAEVLTDFLAKMPHESPPYASVVETQQESLTLFTDGSSCADGFGAGLILTSPEGTKFTYILRFQFATSNNEAEYEALIAGLRITTQM